MGTAITIEINTKATYSFDNKANISFDFRSNNLWVSYWKGTNQTSRLMPKQKNGKVFELNILD
jgi:hypothetical protein